jgi:hypothetical protein
MNCLNLINSYNSIFKILLRKKLFLKSNLKFFFPNEYSVYRVSQKWRTNYLLPYPGCLNVHEKNMEKNFQKKKLLIIIFIINGNTM